MRGSRFVAVLLSAVLSAVVVTVATATEGGATISSAPVLVFGELQHGVGGNNVGGQPMGAGGHTFWRVHVYTGDQITGAGHVQTLGGCAANRVELFAPSVTDATARNATPWSSNGTIFENSCRSTSFTWRFTHIPSTGLATIWMGISSEAPTFSFVAHVFHRTTVKIRPVTQPFGAAETVHATVHAIAGSPVGNCTFAVRWDGVAWHTEARAPVHAGSCVARVTSAGTHYVQLRVAFAAVRGWLPSSATTRTLSAR
jgi:hypothetical protein